MFHRVRKSGSAVLTAAAVCVGVSTIPVTASAESGSRLGTQNQPETIVWMGEPGELAAIRHAIQEGDVDEAVEIAQELVKITLPGQFRYEALNALCVAQTAARNYAAAEEACDEAVAMSPSRWQALNSRGTLNLIAGNYDRAIADYQKARAIEPSDIVDHNLELAQARMQERR